MSVVCPGKRGEEGRVEINVPKCPLNREPHGLGGELREIWGRKRSQAPVGLKTEDVTLLRAGEGLSLLEVCKNTLFICSAVEIQSDLPLLAQEERAPLSPAHSSTESAQRADNGRNPKRCHLSPSLYRIKSLRETR